MGADSDVPARKRDRLGFAVKALFRGRETKASSPSSSSRTRFAIRIRSRKPSKELPEEPPKLSVVIPEELPKPSVVLPEELPAIHAAVRLGKIVEVRRILQARPDQLTALDDRKCSPLSRHP